MNSDEIECLVALFLEGREKGESASPQGFAERYPAVERELLEAIETTLRAVRLFPSRETARPRTIGPYHILEELGRGGMGVVYRARHEEAGEFVALKVLPLTRQLAPKALERFRREASTLRRLQHDQITSMLDHGVHDGIPYIAMTLVEGRPLNELVGQLGLEQSVDLVRELAELLEVAHQAGVLHRDLKPQNVIVRDDGSPVLFDFGLVAVLDEVSLTSTGDLLGTPRYMSPEQALGRRTDLRADVYGLGLILYELVTGEALRREDSRVELLRRVASSPTPRPGKVRSDLPRPIVAVLQKSLAWKPSRRYGSARALADDLVRSLDGRPVKARVVSSAARGIEWIERRPAAAAVLGLTVLLTLVIAGMIVIPAVRQSSEARARVLSEATDRAMVAWLRGEHERAALQLEEVLAQDPENRDAGVLSGLLVGRSLEEGDSFRLDVARALAVQRGDAGEVAFSKLIQRYPGSVLVPLLAAKQAQEANRHDLAGRTLTEASQRRPGSLAIAESRSRVLYLRGHYTAAAAECRRALDLEPDDWQIWHRLARALYNVEEFDEALEAAYNSAALGEEPRREVDNVLAALFDQLGDREAARELLRDLIDQFPEHPVYYYNLAYSLDTDQRIAEALPLYEKCLELDPHQLEATICLAWLLASAAEDGLRDSERAEQLVLDALTRDRGRSPKLLQAVVDVGKLTGQRDRLARLLERIAEEPFNDAHLGRLVKARRALGDWHETGDQR
jgi:Flp pilus assembly protein TadD